MKQARVLSDKMEAARGDCVSEPYLNVSSPRGEFGDKIEYLLQKHLLSGL